MSPKEAVERNDVLAAVGAGRRGDGCPAHDGPCAIVPLSGRAGFKAIVKNPPEGVGRLTPSGSYAHAGKAPRSSRQGAALQDGIADR
jgi:hypothetical protein